MSLVWSKEVAKREFVRKSLKAPRRIRRDPQLRDNLIAPLLDADMDRYVSRYAKCAPTTLQAYVEEILVIRGPLGDPIQAMADALLPNARIITVTPEYPLAMHLTASAVVSFTHHRVACAAAGPLPPPRRVGPRSSSDHGPVTRPEPEVFSKRASRFADSQ